MKQNYFARKFSVGLCLNESFSDLVSFFEKNAQWLNSVYFSLPLGIRFYSRDALIQEYVGNEDKLFSILNVLHQLGIRRELAVNTYNLNSEELNLAISYCSENNLYPEEVVCLRDYGKVFSHAFPNAEIKYSVNNPDSNGSKITSDFHTLVGGKGLLRDLDARHRFIERGFNLTLLLNNGCLAICNTACRSIQCHHYFDSVINRYGLDRTYAVCSFFPSELKTLIAVDKYADKYKFKISNRPLGLEYTQQVLDAYLSLEDDYNAMQNDYHRMALFCTVRPLARNMQNVNLDNVRILKQQWMVELSHDSHWTISTSI